MLALINGSKNFNVDYTVKRHDEIACVNLYDSLNDATQGDDFEGYIILDTLDTSHGIFNPNVMFEFGAVKNLGKPFAVISTDINGPETWPFDVKPLNISRIPRVITDYIDESYDNKMAPNIHRWLFDQTAEVKTEIEHFLILLRKKYDRSLFQRESHQKSINVITSKLDGLISSQIGLVEQIKQLTNSFSSTAEFIDGEDRAFIALSEAVMQSKYSLRTTRFANQSIVQKPTPEQAEFMDALYEKSRVLGRKFVRIICNNHPTKWHDIFNILYRGGNGSRVYVRKADFSIYFELVVIDEQVAFVHFYQQDRSNSASGGTDHIGIERINSTLRIKGRDTCIRFAKIFDRLHHRDFDTEVPKDPSRTLLGIAADTPSSDDLSTIGYFEIPDDTKVNEWVKGTMIINQFKNAFEKWHITGRDKINMAVGIALVEASSSFLDEMHQKGFLSNVEKQETMELYNQNKPAK